MSKTEVEIYRFDSKYSLFQLDQLEEDQFYKAQLTTLKFINSISDIPSVSEQIEILGKTYQGEFEDVLENIAYRNTNSSSDSFEIECQIEQSQSSTFVTIPQVIVQMPIIPPLQTLKKRKSCTCKKSGCRKMYCQCFANGQICTSECSCCNCQNHQQQSQQLAKIHSNIRNKHSKKYFNPVDNTHTARCNCKKSQCQKKYCQCFNSGLLCGKYCKCQDCLNETHSPNQCQRILQKCLIK